MRASPRRLPEPSHALNENHDEAYSSSSTSQLGSPTCTFILAGAAHGASLDVARRALMLVMRLFALSEQEPFVNVMIDKVPRQQLVVDIVASHEKIRIGQRRIFARLDFAMYLDQLMPDSPGALAARGFQAFEDAADTAIAARDHRLEIRFARRFGVELNLSQSREALSQHRDFAFDRSRVLHRIPLKRRPRLGHERI